MIMFTREFRINLPSSSFEIFEVPEKKREIFYDFKKRVN